MPKTLQEYSINAAQSFIQTAVFIDDRIYRPNIVDTGQAENDTTSGRIGHELQIPQPEQTLMEREILTTLRRKISLATSAIL